MALNFSSYPYYDDYTPDKNFYKVLFKPGYAVQARELNQVQSIIQHQISSFANHVFKKNSMVIPGGILLNTNAPLLFIDNIDPTTLIGKTITNAPLPVTGFYPLTDSDYFDDYITATVLGYRLSDTTYPTCLYIKYFNSHKGTENSLVDVYRTTFIYTDVIYTVENNPIKITVNTKSASVGKVASIDKGVFYTKELFVDVYNQTTIIEVDSNIITNCNVGLNIVESIVDYSMDNTLLDNAQGHPNQYAPGADRYKVELILSRIDLSSAIDDEKFINLMSIENDVITYLNNNSQYAELMKTLAKRTYDANGNFIVNGLKTSVIKSNDDNYVWVSVGKGNCYLGGYEYSQLNDINIPVLKPRDSAHIEDVPELTTYMNNMPYFYVAAGNDKNALGEEYSLLEYTPEVNELIQFINISPHDATTFSPINVVGYGVFKELQQYIGYFGDRKVIILKMYFDNITIRSGYTLNDIVGFKKLGNAIIGAPILHEITISSPSGIISYSNDITEQIKNFSIISSDYDESINNKIAYVYYYSNNKIYVIKPSTSIGIPDTDIIKHMGSPLTRVSSFVSNYNNDFYPLIKVANSTIKTLNNKLSYSIIKSFVGPISLSEGTYHVSFTEGGPDYFEDYSPNDYSAFIIDNTTRAIESALDLTNAITFSSDFKTITYTAPNSSYNNKTIILYTTLIKTDVTPSEKTLETETVTINTPSTSWMALSKQDVQQILSIEDAGGVNVTNRYILDNGSTAHGNYTSLIKLKKGVTKPTGAITVTFSYYLSDGGYYSCVDSYVGNDSTLSYIGKIANVYNVNKEVINIRNHIDFRQTYANNFFKNYGYINGTIGIPTNVIRLKDLNISYYTSILSYGDGSTIHRVIGPGIENGANISYISLDETTGDTLITIGNSITQTVRGTYYIGLTEQHKLTDTSNSNVSNSIEYTYPKDLARISYSYSKFKPKHIHLYVNRQNDKLQISHEEISNPLEIVQYRRNEFKLPLAYIYLEPYTVDMTEASMRVFENPVYKMIDIHTIKERVDRNEYYTSLSLNKDLHQEILDASTEGQNVSNRGFWNEDFSDAFSQDYNSDDYKCTVFNKSHVSPGTITRTITMTPISEETIGNYKITGSTVTLPYKSVKAFGCSPASTFNNLNPYNTINWQGKLSLNPMVDNWVDTVTLPVIIKPIVIVDTPPPPPPVIQPIPPPPPPPPVVPPVPIPPTPVQPPPILPPPPKPIEEIVTEINNLKVAWGKDAAGGYHAITFDWKTNLGRTGRVNTDKHLSKEIKSRGWDGAYANSLINKKYELPEVKNYLMAGTHFDQKPPQNW